jgi:hypothetical protein
MVLHNHGGPPLGFVVALRAEIVDRSGSARSEWLIASRWGRGGPYLSIARTLVAARTPAAAPQHLIPRWSALALLDARSAHSDVAVFRFVQHRPSGLLLAGRFAAALGSVHVECDADSIRLRGDVNCLPRKSGRAYQFEGARVAWVGEFIETQSPL